MNVLLVHEAYRNGLDDGALGQALETERALLGHIGAAAELGAAYGLGALGGELAGELLALSLAGGGDYGALSRVLARYDCSDDYWKLTKEGVLLNDGKARLLVEYCTDDGDPSWREVEGSEGEGSVSAALVRYLGADRALGLLGGSVNDFSLYDDQTLRDVLNLDDQDIKAMRRNPAEAARAVMQATALQREKLVGEALMKGAGIVWMDGRDGSATVGWLGAGAGIALTDGQIRGMAAIRSIGPGLYERYSITAELERREGAYQAWINGQKGDLGDGNTRLSFTKWDIDTGEAIGTIVAGGAWNSVDNCYGQVVNGQAIGVDNRYQILGGPLVQGSTIARGPLSMRWSLDGSNPDWGDVMILANTYTIAGEPILADGRGGWRRDNDRWLLHMTKNGSSEGCFVSMASDDAKKDLFMYLKSWGLYQGYSIDSYLYDNNDFAYRYSYKKGRW